MLEKSPNKNDCKAGGGGIMILIKNNGTKNSYNHDEIKMLDNPESEIKFEDKIKYMLMCSTDCLTTKQNSINVQRNHSIKSVKN